MSLPELIRSPKAVGGHSFSGWQEDDQGILEAALPVETPGGIIIEGLLLRLKARKHLVDSAAMIQLEFPHEKGRRDRAVERLDWRPLHTHTNKNLGPEELRLIDLEGSHRHSFDLNWIPHEQRLRKYNLPIAEPMPDCADFQSFLEYAGGCLNIQNLNVVQVPPWERLML